MGTSKGANEMATVAKIVCVALVLCGMMWAVSPETFKSAKRSVQSVTSVSPSTQRAMDREAFMWRMHWYSWTK